MDQGRGMGFGNLVFPNNITSAFSIDTGALSSSTGVVSDTHIGSLSNSIDLDLKLRMSELTEETKVLQNSSVLVLDRETATIVAGQTDQIPSAEPSGSPGATVQRMSPLRVI